jgi:gliding motility-associated-like protein
MEFVNANSGTQKLELDSNNFFENYFIGSDPQKWASQVKSYKEIWYKDIYAGVDVKTLSDKNNFRFDFVLNPGADIHAIALKFIGQNSLRIERGNLIMSTEVGEMLLKNPYAYQTIDGKEVEVKCRYSLNNGIVSFKPEQHYDTRYALIIDPTLVFATYTGSLSDNFGMTATYDVLGNAYTAGVCYGPNYPVTAGAFQVAFMGPTSVAIHGTDISISKFNPAGTALLYSTYLGGKGYDAPQSIVVDHTNELIVFGRTNSVNYPVTASAFQPALAGGYDMIITKFNVNGTGLVASSYMGGSGAENVNGATALTGLNYNYSDDLRGSVIVDAANNIYIGSCTKSVDFPVTPGCLQPALNGAQDAVIVKFDPNITAPLYSTYLGGNSYDGIYNIAVNAGNELYITGGTMSPNFPTTPGVLHPSALGGTDGFVSLISANGNTLLSSTYVGTSAYDQSFFVQLDRQNKVYLYGQTEGAYPVSSGVYRNSNSGQFIHCLNAGLTATYFSTVVGTGSHFPDIVPSAFLVDVCGSIYLSGWGGTLGGNNQTQSTTFNLPITSNAYKPTTDGQDFYFMVLDKDALALQYATFFGGSLSEEHVDGGTSRFDKTGVIYQAICESCGGHDDMPTTPGAWSSQNGSANCNNAVVKFAFQPNLVAAQCSANPGLTGCAPFSVSFTNNSVNGINYNWSFGDGNTSTSTNPAHTYTTAGTYQVRLISNNNNTCNIIDTTYISITVVPPLALNPILPLKLCVPDSGIISFNAPAGCTFTWTPAMYLNNTHIQQPSFSSPINLSTFYKVLVSKDGCNAYDSVQVIISKNNTKILPDPNHVCLDDTVKIAANAVNTTYLWNTGATTRGIDVLTGGWYSIAVVDSIGCKARDSILVNPFFRVPLSSYTLTICRTQKLQLLAPEGPYVYQWLPLYQIDAPTTFNPFVTPQLNTLYSLTVYNGPCRSDAQYEVIVYPLPTLTVTPKHAEIFSGESVTLIALSDTVCTWYPAYNVSCEFCNQTTVSPDVFTTYYAIVSNKYGCRAVDSVRIDVVPTLYIPNCFTPNGDDLNDLFKPVFSGYIEIDLMIFDRWGEMIFETKDLEGGWNGKKRQVNSEMGVYTYKLIAKDYQNSTIEKVGHVTLLR